MSYASSNNESSGPSNPLPDPSKHKASTTMPHRPTSPKPSALATSINLSDSQKYSKAPGHFPSVTAAHEDDSTSTTPGRRTTILEVAVGSPPARVASTGEIPPPSSKQQISTPRAWLTCVCAPGPKPIWRTGRREWTGSYTAKEESRS